MLTRRLRRKVQGAVCFLAAWVMVAMAPAQEPTAQTPGTHEAVGQPRRAWSPILLQADDVPAFPTPPPGWDQTRPEIPRGKLEMIRYHSATVGTQRRMNVYTPPGYTADRKYPVLYLLHGIGGDESEWEHYADVRTLLDNLLAEGKVQPMIIAMPNGRAQKDDRPVGNVMQHAPAFAVFEQELLHEVIPSMETRYSVRADRAHRALAGLSMGGGQTLNFGLGHVDQFAWLGAFSAAPNTRPSAELMPLGVVNPPALNLLWLSCGNQDGLFHISQEVHTYCKLHEVPHIWHVTPHGHDAAEWKQDLYWFVQQLTFE